MAKRRTKDQIGADRIIKARLLELGEKVFQQATKTSRVAKDTFYKTDRVKPAGTLNKAGGTLRDSQNYRVIKDTTLLVAQVYYGKYQQPNELEVAIKDNLDESINLIVEEVAESITSLITNR